MQISIGWFLIGVIVGIFATIMFAVLSVEADMREDEKRRERNGRE